MKKRIGTLKGKPIVEGGGGSNIIKENEININDIGSNKKEEEEKVWYFRDVFIYNEKYNTLGNFIASIFYFDKIKECSPYRIEIYPLIMSGTVDNIKIKEFSIGHNINNNDLFMVQKTDSEIIKLSFKDHVNQSILDIGFSSFNSFIKFLNKYEIPISKEEFYRTDYTDDEFDKIMEECKNLSKNLPEVPEID